VPQALQEDPMSNLIATTIQRNARIAALVRENLSMLLAVLIAADEPDLAALLASNCGTTARHELGIDGYTAARTEAERGELAEAAAECREMIRAELTPADLYALARRRRPR
jgi:hypothetical protein